MSESCSRVMIIAGEASGDHYGSGLVTALGELCPDINIFGMGGEHMKKAGMEIIQDIKGLDVMGFWDVLVRIVTFKKVFSYLKEQMKKRKPDVVVLVDYPGFNIRFAHAAHDAGVPVVYVISPKVWAWKSGRIPKLVKWCDKMVVFFEFEKEVFDNTGLDTVCIGHPLASELKGYRENRQQYRQAMCEGEGPVIGLLPGSRVREIKHMFPVMLETASILKRKFPDACFPVACAPSVDEKYIRSFTGKEHPDIAVHHDAREVMAGSNVCAVTSGTATLETGIIHTPHAVCYKLGIITYLIVKPFIKTDTVGLVNIAAGERIMPELIQFDLKPENLAEELDSFISNDRKRKTAINDLEKMTASLISGDPYSKAVREIVSAAEKKKG